MGSCRQSNLSTSFIFLVFITATTVGAQFKVRRVRDDVFSKEFVELLNDFETLENVSETVHFDNGDMEILTEPCKTEKCRLLKSIAIQKYRKKMYTLQCVNSFLVLSFFHNIKNNGMLDEDGLPVEGKKEEFEKYKTYVARMLSVLFYSRTIAAKWIVLAYTKLMVAADPGTYREFVDKNTFFPKDAHTYNVKCQARKMIPRRNWDLPESEYYESADAIVKVLYANVKLEITYKYASMFTAENLTLSNLFDRQDVLFEKKPTMKINWQYTQWRMDKHKFNQVKVYNTHRWPFEMADCMVYPLIFYHITYTTVLYYVWYHLNLYVYNRDRLRYRCKSLKNLSKNWSLIIEPLKEAIEFLDVDDNVLLPILTNVIRASSKKIKISKLVELEVNARDSLMAASIVDVRGILNHHWTKIEKAKTKKDRAHETEINKPIDSADENDKEINDNVDALRQYISNIKNTIYPIDNMFFIKFISWKILKEKGLIFLPYNIQNYPRSGRSQQIKKTKKTACLTRFLKRIHFRRQCYRL